MEQIERRSSGFRVFEFKLLTPKVQGLLWRYLVWLVRCGLMLQGSGLTVEGTGLRLHGSRFSVQGSGFRVQHAVNRVKVLGFRVQGLG